MRRFIRNLVLFCILPFLIVSTFLFLYLKRDVYLDFTHPTNYSWKYSFQTFGDIATKKLLSSPIHYNSFILGSSRSLSVYACYLQTKIDHSLFFHYANWNESIGGIEAKLRLLDSLGYHLDNVFIYFDTNCTFEDNGKCKKNDHYLLTGKNKFKYYYDHMLNFIYSKNVSLTDKLTILMGDTASTILFPNWESDRYTNDGSHTCSTNILRTYGDRKISKKDSMQIDSLIGTGFFFERTDLQNYKEEQISSLEENKLRSIKKILEKHHSNFYIAVTPLYDQLKFNKTDIQILNKIFNGKIYDFSGINVLTNSAYNYLPDRQHFRPYISKEIIDSIVMVSKR